MTRKASLWDRIAGLWSDAIERARVIVFRKREERELAEELRFHTDMETEKLVANGVNATDARRQSLLALGGVEQVKEEVRDARGTRLFEDSVSDFSLAVRSLRKSPGFAIVAILTLAIGIGATTAVFSAVDTVLLKPLPYKQPEQLVRLYYNKLGLAENSYVSPVNYLAYREQLKSLESSAALYTYSPSSADIGGSANPQRIQLMPVTSDYFHVLRVQPAIGRVFEPKDEIENANVVVLSHALWERELKSDVHAVGRAFVMSGQPYTIVGVMPADYQDPTVTRIDAWVPVNLEPGRDVSNVDNHYLDVVGRLKPGMSIERAQTELNALSESLEKLYPAAKDGRAHYAPLKEDVVGSATRALTLMLGAVVLVLLIVCVNIANLLLVRNSERVREFALRAALGAHRSRLVRQLLIESATLALFGVIAGLLVARVAMSGIVTLAAGSIPRLATLSLDPRVLAFSVALASLCTLFFGLAPSLRSTRSQPGEVLRRQSRTSTGGRSQGRLRDGLVVSQMALAFVLMVGAGVLLASFERLQRVDLGVRTNVLTFELQLPPTRYDSVGRARFYEDFAARVQQIPGVTVAGGVSRLPGTGQFHMWGTRALTGPFVGTPKAKASPTPEQRVVSGNYFRALGIPLVDGRFFDEHDDNTAPLRLIINSYLAKQLFPGVSAIGQRISAGGRTGEVIGVVADVAINAEGVRDPMVFHAHRQFSRRVWELSQVVATTGEPAAMIAAVRHTLSEMDPELVMFRPVSLAAVIGRTTATRVFTLQMLTAFAVLALALAALGLFGVLSYTVKLRSHEFGIRMALGANRNAIRALVLRRGLAVAGSGVSVGLLGAFGVSKLLASLVFQVSPLDPFVIGGAIVFMGAVASIAAFLPAYNATSVDPREVLQGE